MRAELQNVLKAVTELPPEQLPRLLGELEEIRCTAITRLSAPAPGMAQDQLDIPSQRGTNRGFSEGLGDGLRHGGIRAMGLPEVRRQG
jgi:hypothetical protein